MAISYATTLRNAKLQKIIDAIDAGSGPGKLKIYSGTRPATGAAITSQVLLAQLTFSDPSAPSPASGVLTFSAITSDTDADATGTATWARITDSADTFVADLNVGGTGSGADCEINTTSITIHATVSCSAATITSANA